MPEKDFTVTVDIAAPVAEKIESVATEYKDKYVLDEMIYGKVLDVYRKFKKFTVQNDGGIKNMDIRNVSVVRFSAEVPSVDLFREGLDLFSSLLTMVDSIDVSTSKDGDLAIDVCVAGLWKAV